MKRLFIHFRIFGVMSMAAWLFSACASQPRNEQELQAYVADPSNEVTKQTASGGLDFTVTYRPTDLLVAQTLGDEQVDTEALESLRKRYGNYVYFTLQMKAGDRDVLYGTASDQAVFSEALQTLSFRMGDYVTLTTASQDTIPVADYTYPRTFGMAKQTSLMFAFNKEKLKEQEWVSFNLNEFGLHAGDQRFRFQVSDLENVPQLPFESSKSSKKLSVK